MWTPSESFEHSPYSFRVLSPLRRPSFLPVVPSRPTQLQPSLHTYFILSSSFFSCQSSSHIKPSIARYTDTSSCAPIIRISSCLPCRSTVGMQSTNKIYLKPTPPSTSAHSRPSGGVITLVFLSADVDRRVHDTLILMFHWHPIRMVQSPVSGAVDISWAITTMRRMSIWITPAWLYRSVISKDQTFPTLLEKHNKAYHGKPSIGLLCNRIMRGKEKTARRASISILPCRKKVLRLIRSRVCISIMTWNPKAIQSR